MDRKARRESRSNTSKPLKTFSEQKPSNYYKTKTHSSSQIQQSAQREHQQSIQNKWKESKAAHDRKFEMGTIEHLSPSSLKEFQAKIKSASFESMGLRPEIMEALKSCFNHRRPLRPTPVQALGIPASLDLAEVVHRDASSNSEGPDEKGITKTTSSSMKTLLIGAETGSGKTIAYLVPIIQRLRSQEEQHTPATAASTPIEPNHPLPVTSPFLTHPIRKPRHPRALILVPSRDLVSQITRVAKSLCAHHARLTVVGLHGRLSPSTRILHRLQSTSNPVDILVTTPQALITYSRRGADGARTLKGVLSLTHVTDVVVDEADTMLDEGFRSELMQILNPLFPSHSSPSTSSSSISPSSASSMSSKVEYQIKGPSVEPRITYITATLPMSLLRHVNALHPNHQRITTPTLHRTSPQLRQTFIRISGGSKSQALVDTLRLSGNAGDQRVVVFVNTRKTAEWLEDFLRGKGLQVGLMTAEMDPKERENLVSLFSNNYHAADRESSADETKVVKSLPNVDPSPHVKQSSNTSRASYSYTPPASAFDLCKPIVLVATDVASRGMDTTSADHVILYDFPRTAIDYLHRVGRTARNGARGRATSFIEKRDVHLAEMIEDAVKGGRVLA